MLFLIHQFHSSFLLRQLVGTYVKNRRVMQVTRQDIKVAMCADKVRKTLSYLTKHLTLVKSLVRS